MPSLTLDLSDSAFTSLGAQARRHHRSLAEEARAVLEETLVQGRLWSWRPVRRATPESSSTPAKYRRDLERAVEILRQLGCSEIHLFGSLVTGQVHEGSDIDLAVRGCPKGKFFKALGTLMRELDHPVDLVDLDADSPFVRTLLEDGQLVRIG